MSLSGWVKACFSSLLSKRLFYGDRLFFLYPAGGFACTCACLFLVNAAWLIVTNATVFTAVGRVCTYQYGKPKKWLPFTRFAFLLQQVIQRNFSLPAHQPCGVSHR
jgi:hypothetical protein